MARKYGKINQMSTKFEDYNYIILGQGGIGKTTMAYEVGAILTGSDEGTFIITMGSENTTAHIPNAFSDTAETFEKYLEIVEDLVTNRADYPHTVFVAIDSIDELYRLAEEYVVTQYNITADIDKRITSIKQAYGGYQAGENKVVDIVINSIGRLSSAGYKMFHIGHTKTKSKSDPLTGITYEQFTCSVDNKYYNALKDKVNLVATGYFERDFQNLKKKDNPYTKEKNGITTGDLVGQRRVLALVDDDNAIDTKCHFEYIVPKISFSAQNLIIAVQDAIQAKLKDSKGTHEARELPTAADDELGQKREAVKIKYREATDAIKTVVFTYMQNNGIVSIDTASAEQIDAILKHFEG